MAEVDVKEAFVKISKHEAWGGRPLHDFTRSLRGFIWKISVTKDAEGFMVWGLEVRLDMLEHCSSVMEKWAAWIQGEDGTYCRPNLHVRLTDAVCEAPWPSSDPR